MGRKNQFLITVAGLALVMIIGIGVVIYSTQNWGIGVSPDSVTYLDAGNNFYEQLALTARGNTLTHYPPLYPLLLAGTRLGTDSTLVGARWLNILMLGASIVLVYIMILRVTDAQYWSLIGTILFVVMVPIIYVHLWVWSEPLFIFLTLATLLMLDLYLLQGNVLVLLALATLISLATLTRYAGLFLIPVAAVVLLLDHHMPMRKRLVFSGVFALVGMLPVSLWLIGTSVMGDGVANRTFMIHFIEMERIKQGLHTISNWFIPDRAQMLLNDGPLELVTGVGVISLLYIVGRNPGIDKTRHGSRLLTILVLSSCMYVIFLLISISTFDAATPLDNRILSPLVPFLVTMTMSLTCHSRLSSKIFRFVLYALLLTAFLVNARRTIIIAQSAYTTGLGYSGQIWASSALIDAIGSYSPSVPVYSNGSDVIYFYTGRVVQRIPAKYNSNTTQKNERYNKEMVEMNDVLRRNGGILVYFNRIQRKYLPSENELKEALRLDEIYRTEDGVIYRSTP